VKAHEDAENFSPVCELVNSLAGMTDILPWDWAKAINDQLFLIPGILVFAMIVYPSQDH
jgi:hypothetical protein